MENNNSPEVSEQVEKVVADFFEWFAENQIIGEMSLGKGISITDLDGGKLEDYFVSLQNAGLYLDTLFNFVNAPFFNDRFGNDHKKRNDALDFYKRWIEKSNEEEVGARASKEIEKKLRYNKMSLTVLSAVYQGVPYSLEYLDLSSDNKKMVEEFISQLPFINILRNDPDEFADRYNKMEIDSRMEMIIQIENACMNFIKHFEVEEAGDL